MTVSKISNRWLNRVYKSLAVFLVLFAVLISALRLLLPYAQNYRQDVENYINETYDSNLSIGTLSMGWHKIGPVLIANNVQMMGENPVDFQIESIEVRLDFWKSLLAQQLITDEFILTGALLTFERHFLIGNTSAQPIVPQINAKNQPSNDLAALSELADLFYEQIAKFSLIDSKIVINNGSRQRTFLINKLNWLNIDNHHLAEADVIVDGLTSNNLKLQLDVKGNNSQDISGTLFLQGNNLNITPWLDRVFAIENEKTHSSINFSAWLTVENGLAEQLQLAFDDSEVNWQHNNKKHSFALNNGQVLFDNLNDLNHFTINSSAIEFSANNQEWQPLSIEVNRDQEQVFAYLSYVDLFSLTRLFPLFSADDNLRTMIEALSLEGSINELYFQKVNDNYQVAAEFNDFSNKFYQGIPGLINSSGDLLFADQQLQLSLTAQQGALDFQHHFVKPIPYQKLETNLTVNFSDQGWHLKTQKLALDSKELSLSAELGVDAPTEGLATMSLLASVTNGHVELAHHYFPLTSMSESLVSYLKNGLVSGDIDQALVMYNGAFSHFPFEDKTGIFTVDAELTNSQFNFDDDWANITQFDANLNFTNNSMMITARGGELSGLDINTVEVGIADLSGDPVLTVDIALNEVNPANVTQLMNNSSLADSVGKTLEQLVISKNISGHFNLSLPLNRTDEVIAEGIINFSDNLLALQSPQMDFSELNGQLTFKNDVIKTNKLSVVWQGMPLTLSVDASDKQGYFNTQIDINGYWQQKEWLAHVPSALKRYAQGDVNWQGNLVLNSHHDGGFSYNFDVQSNFQGLNLAIPAPYQKVADDEVAFNAHVSGALESSTIEVTMGEQLSFYGLLNHQATTEQAQHDQTTAIVEKVNSSPIYFSRAHLILGNEKMLLPMDGFHITSALEEANFASWQPFVMDILNSIDDSQEHNEVVQTAQQTLNQPSLVKPLIAKPERIRGSINKLNVLGQTLTDVSFNVLDKNNWWLLQLNAKEARTEVKFYPSWLADGIAVDADFLHLAHDITETTQPNELLGPNEKIAENKALFSSIPPMLFTCGSCQFGKVDFGQLSFELSRPEPTKIVLEKFTANRDKSQLSINGQWLFDESVEVNKTEKLQSKTQISGQLAVNDIEFEMEKLGFASSVKESGGEIDFAVSWQGGPQDFQLSQLNGKLNAELDDGVLSDVDDKGVRVASILSLGSLARKLKLDFRDIFSDGMFYSSISGDFDIKNGVMYTNNTAMKGAAGDLAVKGNTNLATGLLDYRMNYKPNLTSSLPTIAWIATLNPVVFLTGLAINEIITATVIYEVVFEVTGELDSPVVREVNRKNQDVSVGSSQPPKLINDEMPAAKKTPQNKFKENKTSDHSKVLAAHKDEIDG